MMEDVIAPIGELKLDIVIAKAISVSGNQITASWLIPFYNKVFVKADINVGISTQDKSAPDLTKK